MENRCLTSADPIHSFTIACRELHEWDTIGTVTDYERFFLWLFADYQEWVDGGKPLRGHNEVPDYVPNVALPGYGVASEEDAKACIGL